MPILRRDALKLVCAGAGTLAVRPIPGLAQAVAPKRTLDIGILGFQLGVHVPGVAQIMEAIPSLPAYGPPKVDKIDQIRTLATNVVAGSEEFGTIDPNGIFATSQQGGDLRALGFWYKSTDLTFVVNSDKIKTYKDLEKPENTVAVNGKGDITHVMLTGPLIKAGVDVNKLSVLEIGGSGDRLRALLAGRVQAVPIHFDQVTEVEKQGPYKVLFYPWEFYKAWVNEVVVAKASWLKKPENARAAVDVLKAITLGFRRANRDFPWYLAMYRKYATIPKGAEITEPTVRSLWSKLSNDIKAWPDSIIVTPANFRDLIPLYRAVGDITGTVRVEEVVDTSYAERAMKELGRQGL